MTNRIEDVRTLAGQTATLSFWAKSDSTRTQDARLTRNFGSGGSTQATFLTETFETTTSWQRFTFTTTVPSLSGLTVGAGSYLEAVVTQALADGSVLDLWGVQLEAGSIATPFKRHAPSLALEENSCFRYYLRYYHDGRRFGANYNLTTTDAHYTLFAPVRMRATPTLFLNGIMQLRYNGDTDVNISSMTTSLTISNAIPLVATASSAVLTAGGTSQIRLGQDISYIELNAEL
jgi:hypothetical protein